MCPCTVWGAIMKKLINKAENVEAEMVEGLVRAFPDIIADRGDGIIVRTHQKVGKVALVSGGGSGHEPAHCGYVGKGMLDAAVGGPVFTSPSADAVYKAICEVATDEGVLLIAKNYTGDVLNFQMAADMASDDDIDCECVVVNDDVAVEDSTFTAGRRGGHRLRPQDRRRQGGGGRLSYRCQGHCRAGYCKRPQHGRGDRSLHGPGCGYAGL